MMVEKSRRLNATENELVSSPWYQKERTVTKIRIPATLLTFRQSWRTLSKWKIKLKTVIKSYSPTLGIHHDCRHQTQYCCRGHEALADRNLVWQLLGEVQPVTITCFTNQKNLFLDLKTNPQILKNWSLIVKLVFKHL